MRKRPWLLAAIFWAATPIIVAAPETVADAARRGDAEAVGTLLARGADVDAALGDGMTGLHWAARAGDDAIARRLVSAGADLEATTRIGAHTPLHVAAKAGRDAVVALLLEASGNANALTTTGATPLHFAAASGSVEAVIALLAHDADPDAREPQWGQTPLMFAAASGRTEVVAALLENDADPSIAGKVVDIVARSERDAAERRARQRRIRMARARAKGAPEPARARASEPPPLTPGNTPPETVDRDEALRRGGEPVPLDYADLVAAHGGLTPLLLAAREGHTETALVLVRGGADINQASAADHTSPMLIATINGHFDLAMLLFEHGADPELASDAGATPLYAALNMHWAPKARHPQPVAYQQQRATYLDVMETLLEAGVDPNPRLEKTLWYTTYNRDLLGVNRAGATPFWRAAHALDIDAMRLLLRYGADPNLATIKVPERMRGGVDATDHSGLPPVPLGGPAVYPIHVASGAGHGQGFAGNSHRHVPNGWLPAVRFLIEELGADVNVRDYKGYNAVHHAAARGDNELIEYLVSKGADPTAVARNGQTTADMANGPVQRVQPYPETIALLVSLGAVNNDNCVSC
jgi:ankyrin repeat protein